ncbi:MAG: phosphate acyltransferase PlsX [Chloroflexi bacterium]|nr:MAG: phosphate acyltransferase PlsX [Chloroflexota bacterium]
MRIVVDAMGSDTFPQPDVQGAVLAAESGKKIILVGQEKIIKEELDKYKPSQRQNIEVVHAQDIISMSDKPSVVGKEKPNSSMHIGMNLVKDGQADAFVTAGNTGAAHAIAMLFTLKRIKGIKRPALSIIFSVYDKPVIILDVGANADAKPEWLVQFALMGSVYANLALELPTPRVALMSNGEEEGKGTQAILETRSLLQKTSLNFIGNIEPKDMHNNTADVIVTDGFTGNILIKTFEASTRYLSNIIREELKASILSTIGALFARSAFNRVRRRVDPSEIGGAPLLGVNGTVIIAHGGSDGFAIKNAINQAEIAAKAGIIEAIRNNIPNIEGE